MSALNGLSEGVYGPSAPTAVILLDGCERLLGLFLLTAVAPILIVSAAVLAVIYRQFPLIAHRRIGRGLEPFWMLKLRTMSPGDGSSTRSIFAIDRIASTPGLVSKQPDDFRVSNPFAAFCRRHSIDELPQLFHVVSGRMSLVGPRPLTWQELECHYGRDAAEVFAVKPGLTGLWQVQGRSYLTMSERAAFDLQLVRSVSWSGRIRIILKTILAVWHGKGAW
jgi:exopolysaccharide production protein ExoY